MGTPLTQLHTVLGDRYEIVREIGRGGMATVHLARDITSGREVAVKVLHPDLGYAVGAERFSREIALVSHFDHPNILPILDSGEVHGQLYYVMPFAEGETLRARLERERQLPVDEALRITCEVADALDYAHKQNVVHRDIKPDNILFDNGRAVVADFGIARALSAAGEKQLTQTGVTLGTPQYMSPEQALADRYIDGRSDVYSLGCVLYEMLAGMVPFSGPNAQAIIAQHTLEHAPSLAVIRNAIPDELEDAVYRAMAKTPADRFASASEFAAALRACQASGGRTLGASERRSRSRRAPVIPVPWYRQRRTLAVGAAVVLLGAAGGLGLSSMARRLSPSLGLEPRRVAVMYFENSSATLSALSDGLTEALIEYLAGIRGLDVISANGVAPLRATNVRADSVARLLKAGTVVRAKVDSARGRVTVTVDMIDGNSGNATTRQFVVPAASVLSIRDSLAAEVGQFLQRRIGDQVQLRAQRQGTSSVAAWSRFQEAERTRKAATAVAARNPERGAYLLVLADSLLAVAQRDDDRWAEPPILRSAIAWQLARLPSEQPRVAERVTQGLEHADVALRLEPNNARALQLRGTLRYFTYSRRLVPDPATLQTLLANAEADLKAATTRDPGLAAAWNWLSSIHAHKLELLDAKLAAVRAYEADAYLAEAPTVVWRLFVTSLDLQQLADASRWCAEGRRRFPEDARFIRCRIWLLGAQAANGSADGADVAEAWSLVERMREVTPEAAWPQVGRAARMWTAAVVARAGLTDSARRVLVAARGDASVADPEGELPVAEAYVRQLTGESDTAIELLKRYLSEHPDHRAGIARQTQSWVWREFFKDPRFRELVGATF